METSKILFGLEYSAVDRHDDCEDCECGCLRSCSPGRSDEQNEREDEDDDERCGEAFGVMVEVSWQTLLQRIKHGESLTGYIDKYSKYSHSESDTQESSDFDRDIIEISEDEGSDDSDVNYVMGTDDDNIGRAVAGGDMEELLDDGSSWISQDSSDSEEQEQQEEEDVEEKIEAPEWFCVTCWYHRCAISSTSPSVAAASEADSSEEESPMLLKIDI